MIRNHSGQIRARFCRNERKSRLRSIEPERIDESLGRTGQNFENVQVLLARRVRNRAHGRVVLRDLQGTEAAGDLLLAVIIR